MEVGTHGVLGGQAQVEGVEGTEKYLTDNVNVSGRVLSLEDQFRDIPIAHGSQSNQPSSIDCICN